MLSPPAIIAINQEVSPSAIQMIQRQLQVDFTFSAADWRASLALEDDYDTTVKLLRLRILVIEDEAGWRNRGTDPLWLRYDIVGFVKAGLINVEINRFGPPIPQVPLVNLTWGKIGKFI